MQTRSFERLADHLKVGKVYRRENLLSYSKAIDRDLMRLSELGGIKKVATGLYYVLKKSRFGVLPPDDRQLVRVFLQDDHFLLFSWNEYNSLNLGLTQLYNRIVVYNRKRHGVFQLGNKKFDFRLLARGFPKKLTPEFLLVDLLNNRRELVEEDTHMLLDKVKRLSPDLLNKAKLCAKQYGKVATKKWFEGL